MGFGVSPKAMGTVSMGFQAGGAVSGAIGAYAAAQGQRAQASIDDTNARLSEISAQAALLQGQHAEENSDLKYAALHGTQRATYAANGVDVASDSVQRTLVTTDLLKEVDRNTIEANAVRAAFGYRAQGVGYQNDAAMRRATSPLVAGASSLLGGGAQVAKSWYTLNKATTSYPQSTASANPDWAPGD